MEKVIYSNIDVLNCDHDYNNKVYAAVSLNGGFATRDYWTDEQTPFKCNYAFFNLLVRYCRLLFPNNSFIYDVLPSSTTVSLISDSSKFSGDIEQLISMLLNLPLDEEIFNRAKAQNLEHFVQSYKQAAFRADYKALEYAAYNKSFSRDALIKDIEAISFSDFSSYVNKLLVSQNMHIVILGDFGEGFDNFELRFDHLLNNDERRYALAAFQKDPYLRTDCHVAGLGREQRICNVLSFSFLNDEADTETRLFLMSVFQEYLGMENSTLVFDIYDAGLIIEKSDLQSVKQNLANPITNQEFEAIKQRLVEKYYGMLFELPVEFCKEASTMALNGIDIMHFISLLEACSYDSFCSIYRKADIMINEAQVIISRGGI